MWPLPSSPNIFRKKPCPAGNKCELPNCLFSHDAAIPQRIQTTSTATAPSGSPSVQPKILVEPSKPQPFVGSIGWTPANVTQSKPSGTHTTPARTETPGRIAEQRPPRTATRPISPPPKATNIQPAPEPDVPLRPRKVAKQPADFTKRLTFLSVLHKAMEDLNTKVSQSSDMSIKKMQLSANQLRKLAVDEEEKFATQNASVYQNVLKMRLVALKKMSVDDWVKARKEATADQAPKERREKIPEPVNTGLTPEEEVIMLSRFISPQDGLDAHGYVTKLPTEAELEETRRAQYTAQFWEVCDRCNTRFQVFPERRKEDGALTSGGACVHHWGKALRPRKTKGEMPGPSRWTCCETELGSQGCTTSDTHVFKVASANRLALVMPFVETPQHTEGAKQKPLAVCFDCEMGYTTSGLELMRLTAVSWPTHRPILDILVKPLGHILDLNTRFSGITPEKYFNAKPYDPKDPVIDSKDLRIVESPYAARDLFLSYVSRDTPLLGHALENDLNCIRVIHPTFVDTVFLYPHPAGLPIRFGLRALAEKHLGLRIQQAGAAGHDSFEDARATGELVRLKVKHEWTRLQRDGWTISKDGVLPPMPTGESPFTYAPPAPSMTDSSSTATKRKFSDYDESSGNSREEKKRRDGPVESGR